LSWESIALTRRGSGLWTPHHPPSRSGRSVGWNTGLSRRGPRVRVPSAPPLFSLPLCFLSLFVFLLLFSKFPVVIRGNLLSVFCRSCFDQSFISFLFARREALSSC